MAERVGADADADAARPDGEQFGGMSGCAVSVGMAGICSVELWTRRPFSLYISFLLCREAFMDSIFGLRKPRQRQPSLSGHDLGERSVPYDQLAAPIRSPIPVSTPTQGLRGISAPHTNPSLTDGGTEFNLYTMQKQKRAYDQPPIKRPASSTNSTLSTADSSTLFEESNPPLYARPHPARTHRSEQSTSNRSPNPVDFGQYPPNDSSSTSSRPASALTSKSDSNRSSRYAPSFETSSHLSTLSQLYHRHGGDSFYFPRPDSDAEIEALFENVKRTRDFPDLPRDLTVDQKWHLVYNDEQIRWGKEKQKEEQAKRHKDSGQSNAPLTDSPEWYLKKFVEKTITSKQVQSLGVSLRSNEMRCVTLLRLPFLT
jgi:cytokinesis protein